MLREYADAYIELGQSLHDATAVFALSEYILPVPTRDGSLNEKGQEAIRVELRKLVDLASRLTLPVSKAMLKRYLADPAYAPQTEREFYHVVETFKEEIGARLFLFVPQHVSQYYEWTEIVTDAVMWTFPQAYSEIVSAGTCLALGMHTACVFHAMRAAEIGLRSLGHSLGIKLKSGRPLELGEWKEILDALSVAVRDVENQPNSNLNKDEDLLFYSEACAQFRFFKSGWRIRVAHARATYNETQAKEAIDHVRSFFEILAGRLREHSASASQPL